MSKYENEWDKFNKIMEGYKNGSKQVRDGHPEDIKIAIESFFSAALMLQEYPDMGTIPGEYVVNLINIMSKYPEYNKLTMDLTKILIEGVDSV